MVGDIAAAVPGAAVLPHRPVRPHPAARVGADARARPGRLGIRTRRDRAAYEEVGAFGGRCPEGRRAFCHEAARTPGLRTVTVAPDPGLAGQADDLALVPGAAGEILKRRRLERVGRFEVLLPSITSKKQVWHSANP